MRIIKDFIALFYLRLDFASNCYSNFTDEPEKDIKRLVKHLQNWEKQRIKEMENKYNIKLK